MLSADQRRECVHERTFDGVPQGIASIVIQYTRHGEAAFHFVQLFTAYHSACVIGEGVNHFTNGAFGRYLLLSGKCKPGDL